MLFPFQATNIGDISTMANEKILVLNADDPHWLFVEKENGAQGFVPASFVAPDTHILKGRTTDRFVHQVKYYSL